MERDNKDILKHIQRLNARLNDLKQERKTYETVWSEILDHCAPDLKGYISTGVKKDGARNDDQVFDKDPERSCLGCASGLFAGISSPARPWAKLTMRNDKLETQTTIRQWLDAEMGAEYEVMQLSTFYEALFTAYYHLSAIGTACAIMLPDYDDVIYLQAFNVGEYWLGIDSKGRVNTMFREFWLSAKNIAETFDAANLPAPIQRAVKEDANVEKPYKIIHVIEPDTHKLAPFSQQRFASIYYLESGHENKFLEVGGFEMFPVLAPRWFRNNGETYGKANPGRIALGDMKQYQVMIRDFNEAIQKVITPPMQAPSGVNEGGPIVAVPGAVNTISAQNLNDSAIRPLFSVNPDLKAQWEAIKDKQQQIRAAFYLDLFMAISMRQDKDMTAEEVRALSSERMLMLGPAFNNFDRELLTPALELIYHYREKARIVDPAPEEAQGQLFKPEYISTLAQSQKMQDVNRITQLLATVGNVAQLWPDAVDKVDIDAAIDNTESMLGAPAGIIKSTADAEKIRAARQQMMQQQQQAQAMLAATQGAKNLGQTPVGAPGQPNAVDTILQGMGMQ